MEVNWSGVARTARAIGGEQNILLLKTAHDYPVERLDQAIPQDNGEGLANGSWFPGPTGWLLHIEGLPGEMKTWTQRLAENLTNEGVEGTLTGAGITKAPQWARTAEPSRVLAALFGYHAHHKQKSGHAWSGASQLLDQVVDHAVDWLAAHGAKLQADIDLSANFWTDTPTTKTILANQARTGRLICAADSYHQTRQEARHVTLRSPNRVTLATKTPRTDWQDTIAELRHTLISAPLDQLSIAMISNRTWRDYLSGPGPGSDYFNDQAYDYYPEYCQEFTLDPCGIQILTQKHLDKANNLTNWTTTRLDQNHYLLESRDLAAWYATPLRGDQAPPPALIRQARTDFGDMILTRPQATQLGLNQKPSRSD